MVGFSKKSLEVELFEEGKNRSIMGVLTLETFHHSEGDASGNHSAGNRSALAAEVDPRGAAMYVIVVILVYGLSIIFLIGSHVFYKHKQERSEDSERLVLKYLEEAPYLRERSARESFKKLKRSLVPVLAESNAKDLLLKSSKNESYLCLLNEGHALLGKRLSCHTGDGRASPPRYTDRESPARILPAITSKAADDRATSAREGPSAFRKAGKCCPGLNEQSACHPSRKDYKPDKKKPTGDSSRQVPGIIVTPSLDYGNLYPKKQNRAASSHHITPGDVHSSGTEDTLSGSRSFDTDSLGGAAALSFTSDDLSTAQQKTASSSTMDSLLNRSDDSCTARLSGTFLEVPNPSSYLPSVHSDVTRYPSNATRYPGSQPLSVVLQPPHACPDDLLSTVSVKTACLVIPTITTKNVFSKIGLPRSPKP